MNPAIIAAMLLATGPALQAQPGLRAEAKVSYETAKKAALASVKGGTIRSAELEREGGKLLYSFDMKRKGQPGIEEVHVDAGTGQVLSVDHEGPGTEARERAQDRQGR